MNQNNSKTSNHNNKKKTNYHIKNDEMKKKKNTKKNITAENNNRKKVKENNKEIIDESLIEEAINDNEKESIIENKKGKKKILICISIGIISLLLVVGAFIGYPKIKEYLEIKNLKNEFSNLIKDSDNYSIEELEEKLDKTLLSGEKYELETRTEEYFLDVLKLKKDLNTIINDERIGKALNTNVLINEIPIEFCNNSINELESIKTIFLDKKEQSVNYAYDNKKYNDLYHEIIDLINEAIDVNSIDATIAYLNNINPILSFLNDNKSTYFIKEDVIEFNKRSKKEYYDNLIKDFELNENVSKTSLIEDVVGPVISANDITIYVGNKLDINSKIKCVDEVDEEVDCVIKGTFNSSKAGVYSITIESTDKSNNVSSKTIKVTVKQVASRPNTDNKPYYIEVIRNQNVVIVYGLDNNKEYNKIVKVFVVSVGKNGKTPTGTFKTTRGYNWGSLIGGVYGQYSTRIYGSYLFHSVPYYSKNKGDLEWEEFNKLGTAASAGCVRMTVRDVKWIFDNIPNGTTVKIYDGNLPSGVTKPSAPKIPSNSPNRGWDPTDPDPNNPWNK